MKILLISDVHSNICALEAIEQHEHFDEVWCCGDLVDFGPFPVETIQWMQSHHARCVLGNHDAYVLSLTAQDCRHAYDIHTWQWAHHNFEQLDRSALDYLRSLPHTLHLTADGIHYQMQHQYDQYYGTPQSLSQFSTFWKGSDVSQRRLVFGHSHRRCIHQLDEHTMWINPGSASYRRPDDHDKRAHYMILDDGQVRFGAVSYDRSKLLSATQDMLQDGRMLSTHLQDAFFFFGDASTTRDPLPTPDTVSSSNSTHQNVIDSFPSAYKAHI